MLKELGTLVSAVALSASVMGQPQTSIAADIKDCERNGRALARNMRAIDNAAKQNGYVEFKQLRPIPNSLTPKEMDCFRRAFHKESGNVYTFKKQSEDKEFIMYEIQRNK